MIYFQATSAKPSEMRRIFTMGLPFTSDHGGQILFGPADGYLYLMMGDGGSKGDPYNFAQNKKSLLGKIMRLDIDNIPSEYSWVRTISLFEVPDFCLSSFYQNFLLPIEYIIFHFYEYNSQCRDLFMPRGPFPWGFDMFSNFLLAVS